MLSSTDPDWVGWYPVAHRCCRISRSPPSLQAASIISYSWSAKSYKVANLAQLRPNCRKPRQRQVDPTFPIQSFLLGARCDDGTKRCDGKACFQPAQARLEAIRLTGASSTASFGSCDRARRRGILDAVVWSDPRVTSTASLWRCGGRPIRQRGALSSSRPTTPRFALFYTRHITYHRTSPWRRGAPRRASAPRAIRHASQPGTRGGRRCSGTTRHHPCGSCPRACCPRD